VLPGASSHVPEEGIVLMLFALASLMLCSRMLALFPIARADINKKTQMYMPL
jgi:hypothetical protein